MKTAFKWFDLIIIAVLIIIPIFTFVPPLYLINTKIISSNSIIGNLDGFNNTVFLLDYVVGLPYFIIGIVLYLKALLKKKKKTSAVIILVKGFILLITPITLFFICELVGYCGLALPDLSLPKIPSLYNPNFPAKDLMIVAKKAYPPVKGVITGGSWECDILVQNNNRILSATEIDFNQAGNYTPDDTIAPGTSKIIKTYPDINTKSACNTITIKEASISENH